MLFRSGEITSGGRDKNSILADALEAIVGAIYLEHGFEATAQIILKWFKPVIASAMAAGMGIDGKTALQEIAALNNLGALEYQVSESGPDHNKSFTAVAMVCGKAFASGEGKSKRDAEQEAARTAYFNLNA